MPMRETAGPKCDHGSKDGVTNLTRSFSSSFSSLIQLNFADEKCSKAKGTRLDTWMISKIVLG